MNKHEVIGKVRTYLTTVGIEEGSDYMISLQGPTIIPTESGSDKFTLPIKEIIIELGGKNLH
jgi:hypothetical protein